MARIERVGEPAYRLTLTAPEAKWLQRHLGLSLDNDDTLDAIFDALEQRDDPEED